MSTEETIKNEVKESHLIYEVGFLLLPTLPEEKMPEIMANIKGIIEKDGGEIISEEAPKMRPLAYEISKMIQIKKSAFDHAYFGWVKFEIESAKLSSVKKSIESMEEILRALFIKTIRESTLMSGKVSERDSQKTKAESLVPEAVDGVIEDVVAPANEEEIDKSIEALVVN
jgi:small subunit ribosomal protein S6